MRHHAEFLHVVGIQVVDVFLRVGNRDLVDVDAVESEVRGVTAAAVHLRSGGRIGLLHHARLQCDQVQRIAPIERQRRHRALLDDVADHGAGGIDALVAALHLDLFPRRADLQSDVHNQRRADIEHVMHRRENAEAGLIHRDAIRSGSEPGHRIIARGGGSCLVRNPGAFVQNRDPGAGHRKPLRVDYAAGYG